MDVGGDFPPMTSEARPWPQAHITRKARQRGTDTRVRDIMEQVEKEPRNYPGAAGELHPGEYWMHPLLETPEHQDKDGRVPAQKKVDSWIW